LKTNRVFIDSQCFVKAGLHFDSAALKLFRKYCENEELYHISTTVVQREVRSKINAALKDALNAIKTFRRKARLLDSLEHETIKGYFKEITEEEIYRKSDEVFEDFMSGCNTQIADASDVDPEAILALYFDAKPPFGEKKKKTEFPDAFSLLSLKTFFYNEEKIYVVSDDSDLKEFCDLDSQLISVETLDKLLDIYTDYTSLRSHNVKEYFVTNKVLIKGKIKSYLEGCDVYNSSGWDGAEVDDGLIVTYISELEPSVLYISDQESQVTFNIDVQFEVAVTGPDYINGTYDREDDRVYSYGDTTSVGRVSETLTVEIFLHYEYSDEGLVNATDEGLYIASVAGGIEVSVEQNEEDWYQR
jgi:hypothetical protein